ncbi:bifunctional FO biosynthesis protein CofGH, partial [Actinosynnema sp. NPDC002837]
MTVDISIAPPDPTPSGSSMRRALRRAADGAVLDVTEAAVLLHARGEDLEALLRAAGRVRDAHLVAEGRPGVVTYSRNAFIPLTRLCRDRCHYCTFATVPHKLPAAFLERDEVLEIARAAAAQGCKEALFTLGDRPEERWPQAKEWLEARGYSSTLDYVRACAIAVLEETGLLPHLNPGVLSWEELQRLRPVAASMGMMLETTAERLWSEKGGPHYGSPDKEPAVRLRVLTDAGRVNVPFTTGILIGIGETITERAESLLAMRGIARQYGHIQEVIIQNFRAKPDTAMRGMPDADLHELAATIAVARLVMPSSTSVQAPPNLVGEEFALMLRAGIDDWGGVSPVTPDHVNPERPWPHVDTLAEHTRAAGFDLQERLAVYPRYVTATAGQWIDTRLTAHVSALSRADGLADPDAPVVGREWQEPDGGLDTYGRADLNTAIDTEGRTEDRRGDFDSVYGDWASLTVPKAIERLPEDTARALRLAADNPAGILEDTDAAMALLTADGPALETMTRLADELRAEVVGDDVTYVVNRNINFSNVCYVGCRFCAFAQRERDADAFRLSIAEVADRAQEAWDAGATEVCMQGGIDPKLPVTYYADVVRAIKTRVPGMHVHAFSPMEIVAAATKAGVSVREWLTELRAAGLDT